MNFFTKQLFVIVICTLFLETCAKYFIPFPIHFEQDTQASIDTNIVQRIDSRFRIEVINPFQSCVDVYDEIMKKVDKLVNMTINIGKQKSLEIDQKHLEKFATFFEILQQTSTSCFVLGKYIREVQIFTNNDTSVAKIQIGAMKAKLKTKQSSLVNVNDVLMQLNNDIKTEVDKLKKQQANHKELMVKAMKPVWWCVLVGPFAPACIALQGLMKMNDLKNSIIKVESNISDIRNKISAIEHIRFELLSQISHIESEIKNLTERLTLLQKLTEALKVRLEVVVKVEEKITIVMKSPNGGKDTSQSVLKTQKLQVGFNLASEEFLQFMREIGGYLKKIAGGTETKLVPKISKEQLMKIYKVFTEISKPDVVDSTK